MKALERRLIRLGPAIARLRPPPRPQIDEDRLTGEEWAEAARIGAILSDRGLAGLSDDDLDLAESLRRRLTGVSVGLQVGHASV
jgi:hypothetical protein